MNGAGLEARLDAVFLRVTVPPALPAPVANGMGGKLVLPQLLVTVTVEIGGQLVAATRAAKNRIAI